MAKFYGVIGFAEMVEVEKGVWEEEIVEHTYAGDMNRNIRTLQGSNSVNDNISVSNEISIIADPYAEQNFHEIRYVKLGGGKWKVSSVEVLYPRLKLTIGGVYNG